MNRPTRVCKRRAPQRQQSNPQQVSSGPLRRRSSRLQSKQLAVCHEHQGLFEQRPTEPKALEPVGATSYASLPASSPVEATVPGPSREQFEEQLFPSKKQRCSAQILPPANSKKRRIDATTDILPTPINRVHLTQTNSQRPTIEDEEAEQVPKFVQSVQQPKPLPLKRPYATFLGESVDGSLSSPALKKYRPDAVNTFVTQWVESISGSESYRKRNCRSDSLLTHSDGDLIPRRLTKSAPNMADKHDADGFAVPLTPDQSVGTSNTASSAGGSGRSGRSLVENPYYRDMNLAANNIYLRPLREQYPSHITSLVRHVGRDRESPGPSLDQVRHDARLNELWMGSAEPKVEKYFQTNIFPDPEPSDSLKRTDRNPMAKRAVPETSSNLKMSGPVPDMLYGYNRHRAFPQQEAQLISMGTEMVANTQDLMYPFFVIEFKGDSPGASGSLWVATNQCLGGSASCVNIAERLNRQLKECKNEEVKLVDSAAFSIAMNGTEARLYISWKHDELKYYMQSVKSFLLQEPDHYLAFRKYVRNIIDWGKDKRLEKIRDSLDILLEKNRETASQQAKSRPAPSDNFASSRHKRKDSRKGNISDHSPDAIQDSQSLHYQEDEEDDPNSQLLEETEYYTSFSDRNGYNPPAHTSTYSTPPYLSEDVSPPLGSHEGVDNSSRRGHRRSQRSRAHTDNSKAKKTRKRS